MLHKPVMLTEVCQILSPCFGKGYILDCTLGRGGYTRAFLERFPHCVVIGIDRDWDSIAFTEKWQKIYGSRLIVRHARFSTAPKILKELSIPYVTGIVLDLGISSPQIDEAERGFSFQKEGPLHMGMGLNTFTATDVVNSYTEAQLADILWSYGEERHAKSIARAIVNTRYHTPFTTTTQLATCVRQVVNKRNKIDPATRTFQALRIYVNQELEELDLFLRAAPHILSCQGRLISVCFHSLEDRLVKRFFQKTSSAKPIQSSRYLPPNTAFTPSLFHTPHVKALRPSNTECQTNARARSARLRWGIRTEVQDPLCD